MDYFRKILTNDGTDDVENGSDTIEKIVDRMSTSTLLEDRRDSLRSLKSLSKKFRLEVGTQALHPILNVLISDREDVEIVSYALEILCNVMNEELVPDNNDIAHFVNIPPGLGCQFTEMFISRSENIKMNILFLEDPNFFIRRLAIQLITICLANMRNQTQEYLLKCPISIPKIVDLLSDPNEVIRNDSLLMMTDLVRGNSNIQKIVVFENAYDKLLTIISDEGDSDGDVIVEDCLKILLHLIENNFQNQTLFKEGSFINRLTPFFEFNAGDDTEIEKGWSAQKLANVQMMLQVVRNLVSPLNKSQVTSACQHAIRSCGLLSKVCEILMSNNVPAQLLTETVLVVAEIMRGCQPNQEMFSQLMAPSQPPQPAINALLLSMVNENQSFNLRCAVIYCFQCFLHKNPVGQEFIIQKLLPTTSDNKSAEQYTAGKLLCMGLFSFQALSTWFAAVSLTHGISNNSQMKEELLKVQLASDPSSRPISLLQRCTSLLTEEIRPQAKIGILMLLCTWLSNCPNGVSKFLKGDHDEKNKTDNLSFLISLLTGVDSDDFEVNIRGLSAMLVAICIKYNDNQIPELDQQSIMRMIERRIDTDGFVECLNNVTKSESYTSAMRHLQPQFGKPSDVIFDYEFTRLFRSLEHEVLKTLHHLKNVDTSDSVLTNVSQFTDHENITNHYKELIKNQDQEIQSLRRKYEQLYVEKAKQDDILYNVKQELQATKDQCSLLKAKKSIHNSSAASLSSLSDSPVCDQHISNQIKLVQDQLDESRKEIQLLKYQLETNEDVNNSEVNNWKSKCDELVFRLKSIEEQKLIEANESLSQCSSLQSQLSESLEKNKQLQLQNDTYVSTRKELEDLTEEHSTLKLEHEDLLVLVSDQEETIRELKKKLGIETSENGDDSNEDNID